MKNSNNNRWSRGVLAAVFTLSVATGGAAAATHLGQVSTGTGADGGGLFGPYPTTGWLTALGLVSVGVVGAVRRRHRALT